MTLNKLDLKPVMRRQLLTWLALGAWSAGCTSAAIGDKGQGLDQQRRFRGIGLVLVVDAVPGTEMEGVVFYSDKEMPIYASSIVARRNRSIMALGGMRTPESVRVVWRKNGRYDYSHATWYGGTILGDHTIPVAARIPDEVLRDIRAKGGALRLKFRLKPDGVLFGWDIERPGGGISRFDMPGGDFLETRY
ncbi:hypothetical protein ACWKW4_04370 [Hydrogenophaga borbori]|uniref:hypothetical protein n=1 Tax=Hydrogenophaga borbori TaxID=2294117 RepID=UPI00301D56B8